MEICQRFLYFCWSALHIFECLSRAAHTFESFPLPIFKVAGNGICHLFAHCFMDSVGPFFEEGVEHDPTAFPFELIGSFGVGAGRSIFKVSRNEFFGSVTLAVEGRVVNTHYRNAGVREPRVIVLDVLEGIFYNIPHGRFRNDRINPNMAPRPFGQIPMSFVVFPSWRSSPEEKYRMEVNAFGAFLSGFTDHEVTHFMRPTHPFCEVLEVAFSRNASLERVVNPFIVICQCDMPDVIGGVLLAEAAANQIVHFIRLAGPALAAGHSGRFSGVWVRIDFVWRYAHGFYLFWFWMRHGFSKCNHWSRV